MELTHEEIEDLLGVYALDAVDPDERAAVDAHLQTCPRCKAEVDDHREVAAKIAYTGAPAPEGIWDRIQQSLEEPPPDLDLLVPPVDRRRGDVAGDAVGSGGHTAAVTALAPRRSLRQWLPLSAAAAALVLVALLAGVFLAESDDPVGPPADIAQPTLDDIARRVLNDPDSAKVELASLEDPSLRATAAVQPDGSGFLLATSLPALPESQTYQLWGIRSDAVISLGVLGNSPGVVAFHLGDGFEALAVTAEERGGVPQSSNPALLVGNVV